MELLLLLFGLIIINGVFAMSEISLVTARKARLMGLAEGGDKGASAALKLGEDPTRFLSTVQIGITSIGLLSGIVGEAALAAPVSTWLQSLGMAKQLAEIVATTSVVIAVTYFSIVLGELVPKRIGQISAEPIARLVSRPMLALAMVARPFVLLLSFSTHAILRVLGIQQNNQSQVTEEEIRALLAEGSEAGVIEQQQHEMMRNMFRLDDRQLGSLMIPRSEVVYLDTSHSMEENLKLLLESQHSRFPVCDGGLDKILGLIQAKQALAKIVQGQQEKYLSDVHPCIYVPETLNGMELLEQFRANTMQMVFAIDEYGEMVGIVTLQDVLEALTGEFAPGIHEDAWAVLREDGSWLLDGTIALLEMKDRLEIKNAPEEHRGHYHTLAGMMMVLLGRVPKPGDFAEWEGWRFEVVDMDGNRVDTILASPLLNCDKSQKKDH